MAVLKRHCKEVSDGSARSHGKEQVIQAVQTLSLVLGPWREVAYTVCHVPTTLYSVRYKHGFTCSL